MYKTTTVVLLILSALVCGESNIDFGLDTQEAIKISKPYDMNKSIDLGKGVSIIAAEGKKYSAAANEIKSFLLSKGIDDITVCDDKSYSNKQGNIIAIGDINSNPLIERLYWNWYTPMVPGILGKSFAIQTVFSPIGVYRQGDVIVLGVSEQESLKDAVSEFKSFVNTNSINNKISPYYRLYGEAVFEFRDSEFQQYKNAGGLYGFTQLLDCYWRNMDQKYFDTAIDLLLARAEENEQNPAMLKVDWNDELNCYKTIQYWDMFSRFYELTDDQRVKIDRLFISTIDVLLKRCSDYHHIDENYLITWNHTNIPLLAIHTITRYFTNRYGIEHPIFDEFREKVRMCFEQTVDNYRPMEESIGYTLLTAEYNIYYYLMENKLDFVENGGAQKLTDLVMFNTDNNGHFAGQGDVAQIYGLAGHNRGFSLLFYLTRDGVFRYMADRVNSHWFKRNTLFDLDTPAAAPERYVGVQYLPIDKGLYELLYYYNFEYLPACPPSFPREKTFDKLQFRSSAKPDADYLLLDGLGKGKHQHHDTNAIISYTAMGYKFLFDSDYLTKKTSDHSIINVCKNGLSQEQIGSTAGLLEVVEYEDLAFTSSIVTDYKGVDWTRNIYWEKERYFVVIDSIRVQEDADYVLDCTWKVLDRGMETFDGKNLVCKAPVEHRDKLGSGELFDPIREFPEKTFELKSTDKIGWWDHRTSARGVPSHRIHQSIKSEFKCGDYLSFQNMFYVRRESDDGKLSSYTPRRINQNSMVVDEFDGWKLLLVDDGAFDRVVSRAKFVSVNNNSLTAIKGEYLRSEGENLFLSSSPINIYAKEGKLQIEAQREGSLRIAGIDREFAYKKGTSKYDDVVIDFDLSREDIVVSEGGLGEDVEAKPDVTAFEVRWQSKPTGFEYDSATDLTVADADKDGKQDILVTADSGYAFMYDTDGDKKWEYYDKDGIYSAAVGDLNGDGVNEIFLGTGRHSVLTVDLNGKLLNELEVPVESSGRYGTRIHDPQHITVIKVHDLDKDGKNELIVGTRTWQVQIFDYNYKQQWFFTYNYHGVLDIVFADMDNDGIEDIVSADRYGSVRVLDYNNDDFATSIKTYTSIGDVSLGITDIDNDGVKEIVNASDAGNLAMFVKPEKLRLVIKNSMDPFYGYTEKWNFSNFGYSYYDVEILKDQSGKESIIAASETGYVYSIDPETGKLNWRSYLGSIVRTLSIAGTKYILAGSEKGDIFLLGANDGRILRAETLRGRIHKIAPISSSVFAVSDTYGNISVVSW